MLSLHAVNSRLALWHRPQTSASGGPVDQYLAEQRHQKEARVEHKLSGLALRQECHGPVKGLELELRQLAESIVADPLDDPHSSENDRRELNEALARVTAPEPDLLRQTVHLAQVVETRSREPGVDPRVREAADDAAFGQALRQRLLAWGHELPPPAERMDYLPCSRAQVTAQGQVVPAPPRIRSAELDELLRGVRPPTTELLRELVQQGPWTLPEQAGVLSDLLKGEQRQLAAPLLDDILRLPVQAREAGLDRSEECARALQVVLGAFAQGFPERVDASLLAGMAVGLRAPGKKAPEAALANLAACCGKKSELWAFAAHEVLKAARDEGPVAGGFQFLRQATFGGWKPSPEQLAQITGQTLATACNLSDNLSRSGQDHQVMKEGFRLLADLPNPYPFAAEAAQLVFRAQGMLMPPEVTLAGLVAPYGEDKLIGELTTALSAVSRVDDLTVGMQNALRALGKEPEIQAALRPLLPAGVRTQAIQNVMLENARQVQASATPATLGQALQLQQTYFQGATYQPGGSGWEDFLRTYERAELPAEARMPDFGSLTTRAQAVEASLALVALKAPPGQASAARLILSEHLRREGAVLPAWIAFCEAMDQGDLNGQMRGHLGLSDVASAGVALQGDHVKVGSVSLRMRKRS